MVELLVMRHAKSDWLVDAIDFDRPLNSRGERAAVQMAQWLVDNDLVPDRVVSSPAERAKATAMAVVSECGIGESVVEFVDELYLAECASWLQVIAKQSRCDRLLVVGHNPGLDNLVDYLSPTLAPLTTGGKLMTTAAIAHFRFATGWGDLPRGSGDLLSLTRPRELGDDWG